MRKFLFATLLFCAITGANAQSAMQTTTTPMGSKSMGLTPKDKWEVGVAPGLYIMEGDLKYKSGFSLGAHVRKALDHTFSLRAQGFAGILNMETTKDANGVLNAFPYGGVETRNNTGQDPRFFTSASTTVLSGTVQLVISLNANRYDGNVRRFNPYLFLGAGAGSVSTKMSGVTNGAGDGKDLELQGRLVSKLTTLADVGAGLSYRVNERFNIGVEQKAQTVFGKRADLIDGYQYNFRDLILNTAVVLNFNIGGKDKAEPLYWVNPMQQIQNDIAELKARPKFDPTDSDGDGVIDMFDQEKNTVAGNPVDTRGITLDSDADGIPNAKDKEPFSPPGYKINADGIAQVPKPNYATEEWVNKSIDAKLAEMKANIGTMKSGPSIADWFLPMIHYDFNRYDIKSSEYENLAQVATVMQKNPSVRILVLGHTDAVAKDAYNNGLSYNRAQAAINYLVSKYGVERSRLVLTYGGEDTKLVNTAAKSYINRRVEFKVANGEAEMQAPNGATKAGKFKGNKSGY